MRETDTALAKAVGQRLKELRKSVTDLGQGEIANEIGVTKQAVNSYENGRRIPDLLKLMALAKRYECSLDYLLGLSETPMRKNTNHSKTPEVQKLFESLDKLAEEEKNNLLEAFTELTDSLALYRFNPNRFRLVESCAELLSDCGACIGMSGVIAERITQQSNEGNLTINEIATSFAKASEFNCLSETCREIIRLCTETMLVFSSEAVKIFRDNSKPHKRDKATQNLIDSINEQADAD